MQRTAMCPVCPSRDDELLPRWWASQKRIKKLGRIPLPGPVSRSCTGRDLLQRSSRMERRVPIVNAVESEGDSRHENEQIVSSPWIGCTVNLRRVGTASPEKYTDQSSSHLVSNYIEHAGFSSQFREGAHGTPGRNQSGCAAQCHFCYMPGSDSLSLRLPARPSRPPASDRRDHQYLLRVISAYKFWRRTECYSGELRRSRYNNQRRTRLRPVPVRLRYGCARPSSHR